jgi:hypothetical protein
MADLPNFETVRRLLISKPKPPVRATVVERRGGSETQRATVIHDGTNLWWIEAEGETELSRDKSAVLIRGSRLTTYPRGVGSHNNWAKTLLEGHLFANLSIPDDVPPPADGRRAVTWSQAEGFATGSDERATGEILRMEDVLMRSCFVADIHGLREDDAVFRFWVDSETGFVLRLRREDLDLELSIEEITIGSIEES